MNSRTPSDAHVDQRPLGTGFTAWSTARDVLTGLDLTGRQAVVTAGHVGVGLEMTRALAGAGAQVTVAARNPDRAGVVTGLAGVTVEPLDLLDAGSVAAFARRRAGRPVDVLIANAGVPPPATLTRDARGHELQFATNHLGHFRLTRLLLPALRAAGGARVVVATSGAHRLTDVVWDDPHLTRTAYDPFLAYGQSKTANVLFAVELDRRCAADGIRAFAAHPGIVVGTALNGAAGEASLRAAGLVDDAGHPVIDPARGRKNPAQGASTAVFGATSPLLDGLGGLYLLDNDVSVLDEDPRPFDVATEQDPPATVVPHAIDRESARRLWTMSERMLAHRPDHDPIATPAHGGTSPQPRC